MNAALFLYLQKKYLNMKRLFLSIVCLLFLQTIYAQEWHSINSKSDDSYSVNLIKSTEEAISLELTINGFNTNSVAAPRSQNSVIISNDDMAALAEAGYPNIPSLSIPIIINDNGKMEVIISNAKFVEYNDIEIAPSKGHFSRSINPDDVPYTYGEVYQNDEFFPTSQAKLDSPYILRDFRAQNIIVTPFSYNPVTKTLRVYHKMTIEVVATKEAGENELTRDSEVKINSEFSKLYERRFINYKESEAKYDVVEEEGDLLIICYDEFMEPMQEFVEWKRATGRNTTMVGTSVAGSTADNVKAYIETQYENNPNLTHVLLVGDKAQLSGKYLSMGEYSGYSDWWFGQLEGNDRYNELIIGRFSAESPGDVITQVTKVINYERDIDTDASWINVAQGVAKKENQYGHNGEDDYQHMDKIRDDLLGYHYETVHRDYQNVSDVTSSAAIISEHINAGVSIINYCNHGSPTGWGVFNYSNSHVNALTNDNMLPFIISVACNNGEYTYYQPCFGETWLRATNIATGEPTGAIGGMFSYISQPWVPPMHGQDEMVDIFVESYSNNIKRTMGGVSLNGNMKILDFGHNNVPFYATYNAWHLFGDPTLTLRNDVPTEMTVTHYSEMSRQATGFMVSADNADGAKATLTRNGEMMGTAVIDNGSALITFDAPMELGEATLTVFGYNKVTYQATINIVENADEPLMVNVTSNNDVIVQGGSVMLNAVAIGGSYNYTYSWSPSAGMTGANTSNPIAIVTQTTTYTCTVNDGEETASASMTITAVCPPSNIEAEVNGNNVTLTWNETTPDAVYNIYRDNSKIASNINATSYTDEDLAQNSYIYKITSVYENLESPKSEGVEAVVYELSVSTFANPGFIVKGESTEIFAYVNGASGDVSYSWTPAESLENPYASSTVATPLETTVYTVTVTCGNQSATASQEVRVLVEPENVTATVEGNIVTLEWDEVEIADYYTVSRDGYIYETYVPTTTYIDDEAAFGYHCYTVQTVYDGYVSPHTEDVCVEIEGCESAKNLKAAFYEDAGDFGAVVQWDRIQSSLNLTEYRVYRSTDNETYKQIQTLVNVPSMNHYEFSDMMCENGTYYYKVTAYYADIDCESDFAIAEDSTDDFVMVDVVSINENHDSQIKIYPNPVRDQLRVEAKQINSVTIVNMMGQIVMRQNVNSDVMTLNLSDFESGMYMLQIETELGINTRQINVIK